MTNVQSLAPEIREEKYPLWGIIAVLALNYATPFVSGLLPYLAMLLCVIRVVRYDEKVFATDYCILISNMMLFQTPGRMALLVYLCLFADAWYFLRRGIKAEAAVVLMILLLNYLLLRMQMNLDRFALCFGQLFLLRILLPLQDRHSAERAAKAFCLNLLVASVYALLVRNTWQFASLRGVEAPAFFGSSVIRFYGPFQDPNYYAMLLVTALALMTKLKDSRCIGWGVFLPGSLLFIACGIMTYSKTFFLMLILLVAVYLVWQFWNKRVFRGIFMTLALLVVGGILLLSDGSPFAVVMERLNSSANLGELTTGRSDVFVEYYRAITKNVGTALFGVGMGAGNLSRDPHNLALEITYYIGLVGMILIVAYYVSLIHAIDANLKKQNFIARYVVLFMVAMVHMTLHGMTAFPTYSAFFLAALAMLIIPKEKEDAPCQD